MRDRVLANCRGAGVARTNFDKKVSAGGKSEKTGKSSRCGRSERLAETPSKRGRTNVPDWSDAKRRRAIEEIRTADWTALAVRLTAYALRQIKIVFGWQVGSDGSAPGGRSPDGFVNEAVRKFLEGLDETGGGAAASGGRARRGTRAWDPDERPLFEALCYAIKSEIRNHAGELRRKDRKHRMMQREYKKGDPLQRLSWGPSAALAPEDPLEHEAERATWLEAVADRPLAQEIVRLMIDEEISDPADLAPILGVDREAVYEEKRWLRRRVREIFRKQQDGRK